MGNIETIAEYKPSQTSAFYGMIPSVVRSRIPVLRSLRKSPLHPSINQIPSRTISIPFANEKERTSFSSASTVVSTGTNTPSRPGTPDIGDTLALEMSSGLVWKQETKSEINWDVAAVGVRLWICARSQAEQGGDAIALRSMHIDALRYMHMALPKNLTPTEVDSLRASIPPYILTNVEEIERPRSNALRNSIAWAVRWIVAQLLLLLPLFMTLLNRILQYEREYQISEKIIANGLDLAKIFGERGLEIQNAIGRFRDGRVGGVCFNAGSWFVEGIVGGVNDGIIQGTKLKS